MKAIGGFITYSFNSRVRYSETDENGRLSITGAINYLQDCSTFQSEELGLGIDYLKSRHMAWWLSNWQIEFISLPKIGKEITISTWAHKFKGFYGYRNFAIQDKLGNYLIKADSIWFNFDTLAERPCVPSGDDIDPYITDGRPRMEMSKIERKIMMPKLAEATQPILVQKHHLDTNHHVNNAQYIEIAREALNKEVKISMLSVQYKHAAVLGDLIYPMVYHDKEEFIIDLADKDGKAYAIIKAVKGI